MILSFMMTVIYYVMSFLFACVYFFSPNNMEVDVTNFNSIKIKKMKLEKLSNLHKDTSN